LLEWSALGFARHLVGNVFSQCQSYFTKSSVIVEVVYVGVVATAVLSFISSDFIVVTAALQMFVLAYQFKVSMNC